MLQDILVIKSEKGREGGCLLSRLITQHTVHGWRIDDLAGVENIRGVPHPFDLLEQTIISFAHHLRDKFTPQPAVSMFPAERALVFLDEDGYFLCYGPEKPVAFGGLQVKYRPQMDLPAPGMRIMYGVQLVFFY